MTALCTHCGKELGSDLVPHLHLPARDFVAELREVVKAQGCDCDFEVRFHEGFQHTMVVHDGGCSIRDRKEVVFA